MIINEKLRCIFIWVLPSDLMSDCPFNPLSEEIGDNISVGHDTGALTHSVEYIEGSL
jgi:hypothetical protein